MLNTHLSGAAGVVGFVIIQIFLGGKILMTDTVNGGLAGLVGITAGCATMNPAYAIITGLIAGGVCVFASNLCNNMKWDDAVGAVAVHGVCGAWGTLVAGIFFMDDIGNWARIQTQLIGIGTCCAWAFPTALATFTVVSWVTDLRVSTTEEQRGLDFSKHHEAGYPEFQPTLLS
jgi:Amt family ammonium transporter